MRVLYEKTNRSKLSREQLPAYIKLLLREALGCKLKSLPFMEVHFGYYDYMYIGSMKPCYEGHEKIEESGLFIENYLSSYI